MRRAMQGMLAAAAAVLLPAAAPAQAAEASDQNDRAVHAFASAVDFGEVQQSMLAVERAQNAEVRNYAQQMISDHGNALHTREMLMQTENSGLLPPMTHGQGSGASTRTGGLPPAYGPGNASVEVDQTKTQRAGGSVGAVGVAHQQGRNPGDPGDAGTREGALAPAHGAGNASVEVDQTKTQRAGGSVGAVGQAGQGGGHGAHAGHGGMQHAQGHAGMPAVTPEMVQQLQAALTAHPVSRPVMESNARNLQVLQGITGPQFDASYMDAQIGAHQYALQQIDRMLAQQGLGDDITEVMRGMRTAVATHLQQAQQIRARLQ